MPIDSEDDFMESDVMMDDLDENGGVDSSFIALEFNI